MRTVGHSPSSDLSDLVEPEVVRPGPRRRSAVILVGVVAVAVAAVWASKVTEGSLRKVPGTIRLAGAAKTFTLDDVRSGRPAVSLPGLAGPARRPQLLRAWREPCTREMPGLQAVAERYRRPRSSSSA